MLSNYNHSYTFVLMREVWIYSDTSLRTLTPTLWYATFSFKISLSRYYKFSHKKSAFFVVFKNMAEFSTVTKKTLFLVKRLWNFLHSWNYQFSKRLSYTRLIMQISDAILQSEDFISLLHRTIWISEFILFHVQDIAKRFFLLPLSAASKMW